MISISWLDGRGLKLDGIMGEAAKACTVEESCLLYSSLLRRARGEEGGRGGEFGGGSWLHLASEEATGCELLAWMEKMLVQILGDMKLKSD